jgi:NADP-dependent aldehyde dehydrogenase
MVTEQHHIHQVMEQALHAQQAYAAIPYTQRAAFLRTIASGISALGDALLQKAAEETRLSIPRLTTERTRTITLLNQFADLVVEGSWLEASIDADLSRTSGKPDIRSMKHPLGPVVVFGASNFPFAYSTAGGDTASALAAGCTVVVKAHPAHVHTSVMVANVIEEAMKITGMPPHVFQHVTDTSFNAGQALVTHPATAAVGFTGSFKGGKALYDLAVAREKPIPVFAEMGSVNPVLILPEALSAHAEKIAQQYVSSITLSVGQFCTNPGILLVTHTTGIDRFLQAMTTGIKAVQTEAMLHDGIHAAYVERTAAAARLKGVTVLAASEQAATGQQATPMVMTVSAKDFLQQHTLQEEIFGPYSLIVICEGLEEMHTAWKTLQGQLTTTIMATEAELQQQSWILTAAPSMAGRIIYNGVPTGVEVCASMVHGGPFPATTDPRFTAVGIDAIKRWLRPVAYQGWPDQLLPAALQDANPLGIPRRITP